MVLVTRLEAVLTFWKMESMVLCVGVGSQCLFTSCSVAVLVVAVGRANSYDCGVSVSQWGCDYVGMAARPPEYQDNKQPPQHTTHYAISYTDQSSVTTTRDKENDTQY